MSRRSADEAIDWYDRLVRDLSPQTLRAFEAWCAADPDNPHEFEQQLKLFGRIDGLGWRSGSASAAPGAGRVRWIPAGLALAGVAAAAAAALVVWPSGSASRGPGASATAPMIAFNRPVRLPDGTLVILSAGAQALPQFGETMRRVLLRGGSARFLVAEDPQRPFIVEAGRARIAARAGRFDVDLGPDGTRVSVIEGQAQVADTGSAAPAVLVAEGTSLAPGRAAATPAPAPEAARVRVIDADNLSLADVLAIANHGAGVPIELGDPALGARRVTGRFDVRDRAQLARRLAAALNLSLAQGDGRLVLRARERQ